MAAAAAPKTLEEVAALASIRVDDLKEFKEADFEELTRELGIPVTAKVKLRGLFRKLLASERVSTAQAKFEAFFERVGGADSLEGLQHVPVSTLPVAVDFIEGRARPPRTRWKQQ